MPTWEQNDVRIYYEESGSGFPILLLAPGGMKSSIPFWNAIPWNPIEELSAHFRVIAMDQRNAGNSHAPVTRKDGWHTYTSDHLGLLDELGIDRCHVLGCCIGGPYCLGMMEAAPERVASGVLLQPIGDNGVNQKDFYEMFDIWADELRPSMSDVSQEEWQAFRSNMFDGDFVYNVSRDFVRSCEIPMLVLMGNDNYHPMPISKEVVQLAPNSTLIEDWKEDDAVSSSLKQVIEFLSQHTD